MMNFSDAQQRAIELASKGDIAGIQQLTEQLSRDGMNPALVDLIRLHTENAVLHIGSNRS